MAIGVQFNGQDFTIPYIVSGKSLSLTISATTSTGQGYIVYGVRNVATNAIIFQDSSFKYAGATTWSTTFNVPTHTLLPNTTYSLFTNINPQGSPLPFTVNSVLTLTISSLTGLTIAHPDGRTWKANGTALQLNSGSTMSLDAYNSPQVYNNSNGRVALFMNGDTNLAVNHNNFVMSTTAFVTGTTYDFNYAWQFVASGTGYQIYNDYGGGFWVGYDAPTDRILIVSGTDARRVTWNISPAPPAILVQTPVLDIPKDNLAIWVDPSNTSSVTMNVTSRAISAINDMSGLGRNLATSISNPMYHANMIANKPTFDFTNGARMVTAAFQNATSVTFAMVVMVKSGISSSGNFFHHGNRDSDISLERNLTSGVIQWQTNGDNTNSSIPYVVDVPVLYIGTLSNGTTRWFEMSRAGNTTTVTNTSAQSLVLGSKILYFGNSDVGEACNSFISEMMYFHRVLTPTELVSLRTYMLRKWMNIPILPGSPVTSMNLNNNGAALTDWPVKITLPYKASYAANFQNIRFVERSTGTFINHWFESVVDSTTAVVWIKVPTLTNGMVIDVYTGYSSTTGDGKSVFPFFDDFRSQSSLDTTLWNSSGSLSVSGGSLKFTTATFSYLVSKSTQSQLGIGQDIVIESSINSTSTNHIPEMAIRSSTTTINSATNGIKGRMDCRGGRGGILNNPFGPTWSILNTQDAAALSINTVHTFKFVGAGNNFMCYLNDVQYGTTFTSALAAYNTDGSIALMNHAGAVGGTMNYYWVRAYKYTSQLISYVFTAEPPLPVSYTPAVGEPEPHVKWTRFNGTDYTGVANWNVRTNGSHHRLFPLSGGANVGFSFLMPNMGPSMRMEFDWYYGKGTGYAADGISMYFYYDQFTATNNPGIGTIGSGLSIFIHRYAYLSNRYVYIYHNGVQQYRSGVYAEPGLTAWRPMRVDFMNNTFSVYLNGVLIGSYTLTVQHDYTKPSFGLTGVSGGDQSDQYVRNVKITQL